MILVIINTHDGTISNHVPHHTAQHGTETIEQYCIVLDHTVEYNHVGISERGARNREREGREGVAYSHTLESFWSPQMSISAMERNVSTSRFLLLSVTTGLRSNTKYWYLRKG